MPTYEYQCDACGHKFEKFQSITSKPIRKCPQCGKLKVKRLISSGAGLIFKGNGFYITDYRSDAYKNSAKSDTGTPPAKPAGEQKSSESAKPAAAESKPAADSSPKPAPPPPKQSSDRSKPKT
jgi:putative FmdB family regulatory protein